MIYKREFREYNHYMLQSKNIIRMKIFMIFSMSVCIMNYLMKECCKHLLNTEKKELVIMKMIYRLFFNLPDISETEICLKSLDDVKIVLLSDNCCKNIFTKYSTLLIKQRNFQINLYFRLIILLI
jgi:hypothetical protein